MFDQKKVKVGTKLFCYGVIQSDVMVTAASLLVQTTNTDPKTYWIDHGHELKLVSRKTLYPSTIPRPHDYFDQVLREDVAEDLAKEGLM